MNIKVGFGFDVHKMDGGSDLWIGGVKIPSDQGAIGHSDADVLIHAICDALLGALNLGDIGQHFPDTDPAYKGESSLKFLDKIYLMVEEKGYSVNNIDTTICLEKPKIEPYIPEMKSKLATATRLPLDSVSIKATTTEKLGFTGRREGIAAYCVALVKRA